MDILIPIGGILLAITLIYYTMVHIAIQERKSITRKTKDLSNLYRTMYRIINQTNVQRITILASHNGDGVPKPGYKLKVTGYYQAYVKPFKETIGDYDNLVVDGEYIIMLDEVRKSGSTAFFTQKMSEGSLLKEIYLDEGVLWSEVFFLGADRNRWYFVSLATSEPESPYQKDFVLDMILGKNQLITDWAKIMQRPFGRLRDKLLL